LFGFQEEILENSDRKSFKKEKENVTNDYRDRRIFRRKKTFSNNSLDRQ
jgi:hypothetical protein